MKKIISIAFFITVLILCSQLTIEVGGTGYADDIVDSHTFIDDQGNKITIHQPAKRIISLSPTHTENLYAIGAEALLIGIDESSNYPYPTTQLKHYRLNKIREVEALMATNPDAILVEPKHHQIYSAVISQLESSGYNVITLMPKSMTEFDGYMKKLGIITGKGEVVEDKLNHFHKSLNQYEAEAQQIEEKKKVFVEISEKGYETITKHHMISEAVHYAGGVLVTKELSWYNKDEVTLPVGIEFIESHSKNIDAYLTMQGDGYTGASIVSIHQKDTFKSLDFYRNSQVYEVKSPWIGRYTFRYIEGINELKRIFYGDERAMTNAYDHNDPLTRMVFANILYETLNMRTFTIVKKDYYAFEKFHHAYGSFEDVAYEDEDFNVVETVIMKSYLLPIEEVGEDGNTVQLFNKDALVSKEEIEHFLYIYKDLKGEKLSGFYEAYDMKPEEQLTIYDFKMLLEAIQNQ